jgi:hypothetical protein
VSSEPFWGATTSCEEGSFAVTFRVLRKKLVANRPMRVSSLLPDEQAWNRITVVPNGRSLEPEVASTVNLERRGSDPGDRIRVRVLLAKEGTIQ